MDFERADRVLVVRGHENDGRGAGGLQRAHDPEAVQFGHLDVEEDEVGRQPLDGGHRLGAVRRLADHFDVGLCREEAEDPLPRYRLIVNDERANLPHADLRS